ncbi:BTAD domain-containing putative transcriptional regulator [Streptomyces sp. NPDC127114]|uniref:AfsR/SARP family transcriptional regulator n=1 Tax=Streptomyces sp. NPDC127114 TaxID=3345366 RepID=UPI00363E8550
MEFRLLGTVAITSEAGELPLGPAKRRSVLAALLLRANAVVPVDRLIDTLWAECPPARARTVVQGHVSRLRALFEQGGAGEYGVELATRSQAYELRMPDELLDTHRFEELVQLAGHQKHPGDAVLMLREALALWRGPALTGTVASEPLLVAAHALEETRLVAVEQLAAAYGRLGEHTRAAAVLRAEAAANPLRESLTAALMLSLYRTGHQSDALDCYHRTRTLLADELGVDPGPALRAAYEAVLRGGIPGVIRGASPGLVTDGVSGAVSDVVTGALPGAGPGTSQGLVRDAGPGPSRGPGPAHPGAPDSPVLASGRTPAVHTDGDGDGDTEDPNGNDVRRRHAQAVSEACLADEIAPFAAPAGAVDAPAGGGTTAANPAGTNPAGAARAWAEATAGTGATGTGTLGTGAFGAGAGAGSAVLPAPDLLPRTPRGFMGRERELAALDAAVETAGVAIVTGPAGVGKTALALHWAHLRADRFEDGVLYADLRGFSPDEGLDAPDVLREFLFALGVPPRRVPESPTAAAALYRSLTEDRAVLVVLDNVRAAEEARPLLPSGARGAAVVTSRLRLGGLVVSELARPVPLGVLGPDESAALLAAAVGADRLAAEPAAAHRLAALCDGLPLALRVTAAQLAARPHWRLADLAAELADEQRRLALLSVDGSGGGEGQGVPAALRHTVQGLPDEAALLFRQLGALPGQDLDRHAAAALLDRPPAVAAEALDRLCDAHLLTEYAPGRHTLHDLVRLYARGLRPDEEALLRLLDHYTLTAMAAARAAEPDDLPCCAVPPDVRTPPATPHFAGRDAALLWYAAERDNLAAAVAAARATGHHDRAWRLALLQWPYMLWDSHDGWVPLLEAAVDSAAREDDPDAESRARALLGWLLTQDGRIPEALAHLRLAPKLAARAGDVSSEATALVNLAVALDTVGVTPESLAHTARAAALVRDGGDVITELLALEHRARQLLAAGDPSGALACAHQGLTLDGDTVNGLLGLRHGMLTATAGAALLALGRTAEAELTLTKARELGLTHTHQETVHRAETHLRHLRTPEPAARRGASGQDRPDAGPPDRPEIP